MRTIKLVSALITLLALTSIAAATANAAETLWHWLPGANGTKFTTTTGKATFETIGGSNITCAKSTGKGEITAEETLGLVTIDFTSCIADDLVAANSLGDPSETILVHVETHNCLIKAGERGILFKLLPVHLEIPAVSELLIVEGSFVGSITPSEPKKAEKEYTTTITQKKGKQTIEKCEGGTKENLTSEPNENKKPEEAAEEVEKGTLTWTAVNQEAMA